MQFSISTKLTETFPTAGAGTKAINLPATELKINNELRSGRPLALISTAMGNTSQGVSEIVSVHVLKPGDVVAFGDRLKAIKADMNIGGQPYSVAYAYDGKDKSFETAGFAQKEVKRLYLLHADDGGVVGSAKENLNQVLEWAGVGRKQKTEIKKFINEEVAGTGRRRANYSDVVNSTSHLEGLGEKLVASVALVSALSAGIYLFKEKFQKPESLNADSHAAMFLDTHNGWRIVRWKGDENPLTYTRDGLSLKMNRENGGTINMSFVTEPAPRASMVGKKVEGLKLGTVAEISQEIQPICAKNRDRLDCWTALSILRGGVREGVVDVTVPGALGGK